MNENRFQLNAWVYLAAGLPTLLVIILANLVSVWSMSEPPPPIVRIRELNPEQIVHELRLAPYEADFLNSAPLHFSNQVWEEVDGH